MAIRKTLLRCILLTALSSAAFAASAIATRPDDPKATYLKAPEFAVHGDGTADDSAAIQAAIDATRAGVVFVPPGRYRLSRTIFVWPAVRVIGYGATRPVFVLPPNTPGFQKGVAVMVTFAGARGGAGAPPGGRGARVPFPPPDSVPPNDAIQDANQNTFYCAMSNIDFEIGEGNPSAVAIRFHVAQHAFLTHMDFHVGSGLAALTEIGNEAEDLHFFGGRYAITYRRNFAGMAVHTDRFGVPGSAHESSIREHNVGLTLIRDSFHDVPTAIEEIDPH